jgi:3-oxoacyl-[acyl-carrier protein] reductase
LANEGVNVGITGRNEENLKNTVEEIKNWVKSMQFSIDNEAEVKSGIESLAEQLGGVDILINNAGIGDLVLLKKCLLKLGNR